MVAPLKASLMRIQYSKHVSGACKLIWNFLQEGRELEPFDIIDIDTYFTLQCGAVKIVSRGLMFVKCINYFFPALSPERSFVLAFYQ